MQEYRSGHNEAVLKTVCSQGHGGSNPSSCANETPERVFFLLVKEEVEKHPNYRGFARGARNGDFAFSVLLASDDTLANANLPLPAPTKHPKGCFFVGEGRG